MILKSRKLSLLSGLLISILALYGSSSCKKDDGGDDGGSSSSKSGDDDDDDDDDNGSTEAGTLGVGNTDNELAVSYPEGLNVTAFPTDSTDSSEAGTVMVDAGLTLVEPPPGQICNTTNASFQCYLTDENFQLTGNIVLRDNAGPTLSLEPHGNRACMGIFPDKNSVCEGGDKPQFSDSVTMRSFDKKEEIKPGI